LLELKNITKKFNDFTAIENVSINVDKKSAYGLVGYNGAGKTTLLKTICGIYKPEQGEVLLDGKPVFDNERNKSRIFLVPDEPYIIPQANMKRMAKFYRTFYTNWDDALFNNLVKLFQLDADKRLSSFSKGMQKQAAIIFSLAVSAEYILFDEIFDGLDPIKHDLVKKLLSKVVSQRGISMVVSSHNLREIEDLCSHIFVLNKKEIVYDSSMKDMLENHYKYRVSFTEKVDDAFIADNLNIANKGIKTEGNTVTFITSKTLPEITAKLQAVNPLQIETLSPSFEEIFLAEMDTEEYNLANLFAGNKRGEII
jgi:ABC-2 type transport system ATP-binding protein